MTQLREQPPRRGYSWGRQPGPQPFSSPPEVQAMLLSQATVLSALGSSVTADFLRM